MTITLVLLILFAAAGLGFLRWRRRDRAATSVVDYNTLTTGEQKYIAVETEHDPATLRAMWASWRGRGWAEGGILHAHVLDRLDHLGADLSDEERDVLNASPERVRRGATLPTIHGRGGES